MSQVKRSTFQAGFEPSTHYESVRRLASYDHRQLHAVRVEFPGLRCSERPAPVLADGASGSQVHERRGELNRFYFDIGYRYYRYINSVNIKSLLSKLL